MLMLSVCALPVLAITLGPSVKFRPPIPAYLYEDWWNSAVPTIDSTATQASLSASGNGEEFASDPCFWATAEPEQCEDACEQGEECTLAPIGSSAASLATDSSLSAAAPAAVQGALDVLSSGGDWPLQPVSAEALSRAPEAMLATMQSDCAWHPESDECDVP